MPEIRKQLDNRDIHDLILIVLFLRAVITCQPRLFVLIGQSICSDNNVGDPRDQEWHGGIVPLGKKIPGDLQYNPKMGCDHDMIDRFLNHRTYLFLDFLTPVKQKRTSRTCLLSYIFIANSPAFIATNLAPT